MRVLVVTQIFPNAADPASAPFNRQQLAALHRRCQVEVLATIPWFPGAKAFSRWSRAGRQAEVPATERIDGIEVIHPRVLYVPRVGHALSAALYAGSMLPDILRRRGRYDVLLGTWAYPDGVAAVALGKALGVPTVVKLHGSDMDVQANRPLLRQQLGLALPRAARVVAVSRTLGKAAEELGVPPDRIDIVTNGVDASVFFQRDRAEARALVGRPGDTRKWILFVGRLVADKGVLDLAAAFRQVAQQRPDAVLVLVGDGPGRAAAEAALKPLGERVYFAGARPLSDVPLWMGACDVLTLPSHHEGTPNVLLEGLACGRRVVATRVGGIPDVIHRPELGELVPVGDVEALTAALVSAVDTPYDAAAVAAIGARGGWDESAAKLQASLERAVRDAGGAAAEPRPALAPAPHPPKTTNGVHAPAPPLTTSQMTDKRDMAPNTAPKMAPARQTPGLKSRVQSLAARSLPRSLMVTTGDSAGKKIALTFDDGPDGMTDEYLDVLDRYGARATFFLIGENCRAHPDAVRRIVARGHEVAGHGFTHRAFPTLDDATLKDELQKTAALLPPTRTPRQMVRPPRGATSVRSLATCARAGYTTVMWSRDSDDCRTTIPEEVAARVAPESTRPGEIVLLHEGQRWTLDALPLIIQRLHGAGWQTVPVGEMLG